MTHKVAVNQDLAEDETSLKMVRKWSYYLLLLADDLIVIIEV